MHLLFGEIKLYSIQFTQKRNCMKKEKRDQPVLGREPNVRQLLNRAIFCMEILEWVQGSIRNR